MIPGWRRVAEYIASNPGCRAMDIMHACGTANHTGRISDARRHGWIIEADKEDRYYARRIEVVGGAETRRHGLGSLPRGRGDPLPATTQSDTSMPAERSSDLLDPVEVAAAREVAERMGFSAAKLLDSPPAV